MATNPVHLREIERIIASVIIVSSDGLLLLGRKDSAKGGVYADAWHLPGGGTEDGESLEDAARREAQQEVVGLDLTGVQLVPVLPVGHGESAKVLASGEKVWCKMAFNRFEIRLDKTAAELESLLKPGDDLVRLQWFDRAALANTQLIPGGAEFFLQAGYLD